MGGVLTLRLPEMLHLSPDQVAALKLVIEWEGKTLTEFVRWCLLPAIRASYDEIRGFALQQPGYKTGNKRTDKKAQSWAAPFHSQLEPLMAGKEADYAK